tara:strand:- start:1594 stop:1872 length:279 start_codon:yes stop_codon:yes gene_type:complete
VTVLEIMERCGSRDANLTIAFIKDAIHLINSNTSENISTWKTDIVDGIREYPIPANMLEIRSISVLDTTDSKYKRIRRLSHPPIVSEDTDPE